MPTDKRKPNTAKQLLKRFYEDVPNAKLDDLIGWLVREMPNASEAQCKRKLLQIIDADRTSDGLRKQVCTWVVKHVLNELKRSSLH